MYNAPEMATTPDFLAEIRWRGLYHDATPGLEDYLKSGMAVGYVGFDPTADSLHIGNMVPIMLLTHFQRAGHKPFALVGGATGMVGDPSGKSEERKLLDRDQLAHNVQCIHRQLASFLDFGDAPNRAEMVNNYDWFAPISFLDFLRDVGKHITVNYMLAKDSVQKRLETGLSFTEFSYQLLQGYDFAHLAKHHGVRLQMGGSDQWGNITTGTELIRRMGLEVEAYAMTAPLITKADGSKFGKSESGNVWLDPAKTSPYKFYQFWLNLADEDAPRMVRIFSLKGQQELEAAIAEAAGRPEARILQKLLAEEFTARLHGADALLAAQEATDILFGGGTLEALQRMSPAAFAEAFEGVPTSTISRSLLEGNAKLVDLLAESGAVASKSEARRQLAGGSIRLNKEKVTDAEATVGTSALLAERFLLLQIGKKKYHLLIVE